MEMIFALIGIGVVVGGGWLLVKYAQYRMEESINDVE